MKVIMCWLMTAPSCVISPQGSFRPLLCQILKPFMPRTSTTLGPSPQLKAFNWRTRTLSFLMSLPRGTSPSPGRRRWLRQASMESSRSGEPTALCPMTCDASPSWSNHPSPPPAPCHKRLSAGMIIHYFAYLFIYLFALFFMHFSYLTEPNSSVIEGEC